MYSFRIEQALRAATILHKDQMRKGSIPIPYVSHLVAVAMLAQDYTDNEDVIVACLLHDTLEDTDYTADELQKDFGPAVRELVEIVSEPSIVEIEPLTWKERKQQYIDQLKNAHSDALIVCASDKIHNMRTIVEEYTNNHIRFMADFAGSLEDRMYVYQDISNTLNRNLKNDIIHEFNSVFEQYKNFITNVKKTKEKQK